MPSKKHRFPLVCLTVVIALAALLLIASRTKSVTTAESEKMPMLQGDQATEFLQKQNLYASLGEAIKAARYQINLETTPFAELPTALQAANPAQHFSAYFTSAGMLLAVRDDAAAKTDGASAQGREAAFKRLEMRLETQTRLPVKHRCI